jgi:hypothetical protein
MNIDEVKSKLKGSGHRINKEGRLGNNSGTRLRLEL